MNENKILLNNFFIQAYDLTQLLCELSVTEEYPEGFRYLASALGRDISNFVEEAEFVYDTTAFIEKEPNESEIIESDDLIDIEPPFEIVDHVPEEFPVDPQCALFHAGDDALGGVPDIGEIDLDAVDFKLQDA